MRKFKFWTATEDKMLNTCISKFSTITEAASWAAKKLGRTEKSVYVRMYMLKRNNGKAEMSYVDFSKPTGERRPHKVHKKRTVKQTPAASEGVEVPKGFTFEVTPKKVTMFKDHLEIYF